MSETQSYKTVTFSPEQAEVVLRALECGAIELKKEVKEYEDALWTDSAARAQASLNMIDALIEELRA